MPYRGWSERSWRDFDDDDAMIVGGAAGLIGLAVHGRCVRPVRGFVPWIGALGLGVSAGYAARQTYSFALTPSACSAASERGLARKQEAARWAPGVHAVMEAKQQRAGWMLAWGFFKRSMKRRGQRLSRENKVLRSMAEKGVQWKRWRGSKERWWNKKRRG